MSTKVLVEFQLDRPKVFTFIVNEPVKVGDTVSGYLLYDWFDGKVIQIGSDYKGSCSIATVVKEDE